MNREMLYEPPDRHHDECEICHQWASQLWEDQDSPGEFLVCADCIRRICRKQEAEKEGA